MAASLRRSLLAFLLASSLIPIAGLGWIEHRALAEAHAAEEARALQGDALAAALAAEGAVARGEDPAAAAARAAPDREVRLVARARASDWPELFARAGETLLGADMLEVPGLGAREVAWARAPAADALAVAIRAPEQGAAPFALPFVLLATFAAAGVAIVLAFVALRVVRPVAELERASARLARGEWAERVEVDGPRELRALAESFNRMTEALARQRGTLNALLDERTRALIDTEGDLDALRFTLAHEFREPLRSLRWMTDDLLERRLSASDREAVMLLRRRIDDIDAVFRDLLRYEDVSRKPAPMADVALADVVRRAHAEAERAGPLTIHAEPTPTVRGNAELLLIAFTELLRNASLHARGRGGRAIAHVRAERDGDDVVLHVDDEGPGIPVARREDALHLFQRLRRDAPGTGAGLAIARRAVERHGGTLAIGEAPEGGARVTVRLPAQGLEPRTPLPREPVRRTF